jgi:hypothetical protein
MSGGGALFERQITAGLLILCFVVFAVGGILFTGRAFLKWPAAEAPGYLIWERSFIIAAALINLAGLALLEGMLRAAGDTIFARVGLITMIVAVAVLVPAEVSFMSTQVGSLARSQVVIYIVLAFLAQAAFGVALLRTDLLPGWVGWATIIWNLAWLVILPIFSSHDMYYPVLHHTAPLMIGIALLVKG